EEWLVQRMRKRPQATSKNKAIQELYGNDGRKMMSIPRVVDDYHHHMGGVDTADQLRQYYTVQMRKSRTWMPLFLWLLDTSINAYIMWTIQHGSKSNTCHREFRLKLVNEFVELSYKLERAQETLDKSISLKYIQTYITTNKITCPARSGFTQMHYPIQKAEDEDYDKENLANQDRPNNASNRMQCEWCRYKSLKAGRKRASQPENASHARCLFAYHRASNLIIRMSLDA
ncbi:hypothetical protein BGZ65_007774, partial [Modicella reniformis]